MPKTACAAMLYIIIYSRDELLYAGLSIVNHKRKAFINRKRAYIIIILNATTFFFFRFFNLLLLRIIGITVGYNYWIFHLTI